MECPICYEYDVTAEDLENMMQVAGSETSLCPACEEYSVPVDFNPMA